MSQRNLLDAASSSPLAPMRTSEDDSAWRLKIPRVQLTDILQYTPQIPSICCAAAHPHLRYARETVAGTRAERVVQHRGDLYVCWDWTTNREYHSLSGEAGDLTADLAMMAWWLTRPFLGNGEPMILEVNVKKHAHASRGGDAEKGLASLLRILTTPPYQQSAAGISCLRSLIFTPNRLEVTPEVLALMGQLTHLEKLECFSQSLSLPLPAIPSVYVVKLRNLKTLTSITPLLPLQHLRKVSLCRCSELRSLAALSALPELAEVRLANCRQLDLKGDYAACRQLTSLSMRWCTEVLHSGDLATLPNLLELDCSYCGLQDVEGLARCARLRRLSLRGCQTIHQLFPTWEATEKGEVVPAALPTAGALPMGDVHNTSPTPVSLPSLLPDRGEAAATSHDASAEVSVNDVWGPSAAPQLWALEELDAGESSLASLTGVAHCAPELRHLTVRECRQLHSLSPLGTLPTLTSVDASFSSINDLEGLSASFSLEYVNLKNCTELRSVAPLAKVQSLREVDLSVLRHNCIICIDDSEETMGGESARVRRRRSELVVLSAPAQLLATDETLIDTSVTQRSAFGMSQHKILRKDAEKLLTQSLEELRVSEASTTDSII